MDERILKYFQNSLAPNERLLLLREIEKNEELKKQFAEYQNIQALLNLSSHTEDKKEGEISYQHFQKRIKSKKNAYLAGENNEICSCNTHFNDKHISAIYLADVT